LDQGKRLGDVDAKKLQASIDAVVEGYGLPRSPRPGEVFDPSFLPSVQERRLALPA
jgi:NitT/TauT family transport system substrate-binding protein